MTKQLGTVLMVHPGSELYGADRVFLDSARALASEAESVTVILPSKGPLAELLVAEDIGVSFQSMAVLRRSSLSLQGLLGLASLLLMNVVKIAYVVRLYRPDLVYVSTITIPGWTVVPRLFRVKVILHLHEAESSTKPLIQRIMTAPVRAANRVVANSEFSRRVLLQSWPSLETRIRVLHNAIAASPIDCHPRETLSGQFRLLYIGRLSERKGIDIAILAVAEARGAGVPVHLTVVGSVFAGNEQFESDLLHSVSRLGLTEHVHFHGFQAGTLVYRLETDAAIVPSSWDESYGNTAVEAIMHAQPLIVSDRPGLMEATRGYESVISVEPKNVHEFARAMARMYENWEWYREKSVLDSVEANRRHSPERYRDSLVNCLADATRSASSRRNN